MALPAANRSGHSLGKWVDTATSQSTSSGDFRRGGGNAASRTM
jgi:hypothetical protein